MKVEVYLVQSTARQSRDAGMAPRLNAGRTFVRPTKAII
jgi:hypothetical protein